MSSPYLKETYRDTAVQFLLTKTTPNEAAHAYMRIAEAYEAEGLSAEESRHCRVMAAYAMVLANKENMSLATTIMGAVFGPELTKSEEAELYIDMAAMYELAGQPENADEYLSDAEDLLYETTDPAGDFPLEILTYRQKYPPIHEQSD